MICRNCNDIHALVDYDSDEDESSSIKIDQPGAVYTDNKSFYFLKSKQSRNAKKAEFLVAVNPLDDMYELNFKEESNESELDPDNLPWLVIKYVFPNADDLGYRIKQGDLIKLGKFLIKVRKIRIQRETNMKTMLETKLVYDKSQMINDNEMSNNILNRKELSISAENYAKIDSSNIQHLEPRASLLLLNNSKISSRHPKSSKTLNRPECRICLSDDCESNNPLINPCKCAGTSKYIHIACLRQLISSKITKKQKDSAIIYQFKTLQCDVCKSLLPERVKYKDKVINIIEFQKPESTYIILEGKVKNSSDPTSFFIIELLGSAPLTIGRSLDNDIQLDELSVSRSHATLTNHLGSFYLRDWDSKFGTLVCVGNKINVIPNKPLSLQVKKFYFKFSVKKKFWAFITCYKPKQVKFTDYNEFFEKNPVQATLADFSPNMWEYTQAVSEISSNSLIPATQMRLVAPSEDERNDIKLCKIRTKNLMVRKDQAMQGQFFQAINYRSETNLKAYPKPSIHLNINIQVNSSNRNKMQKEDEDISIKVKNLGRGRSDCN